MFEKIEKYIEEVKFLKEEVIDLNRNLRQQSDLAKHWASKYEHSMKTITKLHNRLKSL